MTYLIIERHYYRIGALDSVSDDFLDVVDGNILEFETEAEAQAYVDELNADVYVLGHNEYSRPTYTIAQYKSISF